MLYFHRPRLITAVIYALLGIATFAVESPAWLVTMLWPIRAALFGAGFLALVEWIKESLMESFERVTHTRVETKASHLAEQLRYMTTEQLELLRATLTIGEPTGEPPKGTTVVDGISIPDEWIEKHFKEAKGTDLQPIRKYAEGSMDRMYASALHSFLVKKGAAMPAAGNRPTKVKSWPEVSKALGWS